MLVTDKVSQFVNYGEIIRSTTAISMKLDNTIPADLLPKAILVAKNIIDPVRVYFDKAAIISSFYRCPALNQMISNKPDSQHTKGEAVDFIISGIDNLKVAEFIRDTLVFDQLILERTWIHCSYVADRPNRKETLHSPDGRMYIPGLFLV